MDRVLTWTSEVASLKASKLYYSMYHLEWSWIKVRLHYCMKLEFNVPIYYGIWWWSCTTQKILVILMIMMMAFWDKVKKQKWAFHSIHLHIHTTTHTCVPAPAALVVLWHLMALLVVLLPCIPKFPLIFIVENGEMCTAHFMYVTCLFKKHA